MNEKELRDLIEPELADALESRTLGKEGRARVCARRAAGIALGSYYEKELGETPPQSAYQLLQWFSQREEVPHELRETANRLTVRVTKAYELPHREDPLEDAQTLVNAILEGEI